MFRQLSTCARESLICTSNIEHSIVFSAQSHDTGYDDCFAADDVTQLAVPFAVSST